MYCKMCGTENQENAKFCYKCGEKLEKNELKVDENELLDELNADENNELDEFQKKYIERLENKLHIIDELESDDLKKIYFKAKSYNIPQEYIDSVIEKKNKNRDELFKYIEMIYEETSDYALYDEQEEEIINFGQRLGLSEENIREYLGKYDRQNNIHEKAEVYKNRIKLYIGECFSEAFKEDLGNDPKEAVEEKKIEKKD